MTAPGRSGARYDVVVVGGGPAGCSCAIALARAGRRVALIERGGSPRHRLCGEFLSGESRRALGALGCLPAVEAQEPARLTAARFRTPSGRTLSLPLSAPAFGLSRYALDALLLRQASANGVEVSLHTEVTSVDAVDPARPVRLVTRVSRPGTSPGESQLLADLVVAAWGRRSTLDRQLHRAFSRRAHDWVGVKRHHRVRSGRPSSAPPLDGVVEVHAFEGGYCGVNEVEGGMVNVCALIHQRHLRGLVPTHSADLWTQLFAQLARRHEPLASRLDGLAPVEETTYAVAQIPFETKELASGRVLFVGDSAGVITPVCGDGQAMGLDGGLRLGALIGNLPPDPSPADCTTLGRAWTHDWSRTFGRRMKLGRLLQRLVLHAPVAELTLASLACCPPVARWLVRSTRGSSDPLETRLSLASRSRT